MTPLVHNKTTKNYETALKLRMPTELSDRLKQLAAERAISVSALIRLVLAEYVRGKK